MLSRLADGCERDADLRAAWLGGSLARGIADEWSGIDLHVGVPVSRLTAMVVHVTRRIQRIGELAAAQTPEPKGHPGAGLTDPTAAPGQRR